MSRVLLLIPTSSYRTADFVEAAGRLGIEMIVASNEPPPLDMGDRYLQIDCDDPDESVAAIVDLADEIPIDAIVPIDDAGVVIASLASRRLGLAGNAPEAARATRDKLSMRRLLQAREVPQPSFQELERPDDLTLDFPVVLKPRTGSASVGVWRVDSADQLPTAFARVRGIADGLGESGPLLAEAYVEGRELAVECHVAGGRLVVLAHFDKPHAPAGPSFPETLLVTPPDAPADTIAEIDRTVASGVAAIGLTDGPVHAEVRVEPGGEVRLLEVAARSIGGLCSRSLLFGLRGSRLEDLILAAAVGRAVDARRQPRASGVMMLGVAEPGRFERVEGIEAAIGVGGISSIDLTVAPGTRVDTLPKEGRYLGFIFAQGPTPDDVISSLERASRLLEIVISPTA